MSVQGNSLNDEMNALINQIDATKRDEKFVAWMDFLAAGYNYSFGNWLLICMQRPDFTNVRSFRAWKKFKRYPRQGCGIKILFPKTWYKRYDKNGELIHWSDKTTKCVRREFGGLSFGVGNVWDVSDTEGEPLPEVQWHSRVTDETLIEKLIAFCGENNISVEFRNERERGAQGWSELGKIVVFGRSVSVFVHEIAHELLHDKKERSESAKTQLECEAEVVSAIICKRFGIDTNATSAAYLANWGVDAKVIRASTTRIQGAVEKICKSLGAESESEGDEE